MKKCALAMAMLLAACSRQPVDEHEEIPENPPAKLDSEGSSLKGSDIDDIIAAHQNSAKPGPVPSAPSEGENQ